MLVEDEPHMVRTLSRILERRGFSVSTASNGREALGRLAGEPVDLMVTDLNMPTMDGLTLLRELPVESRPAIVVLTGYGTVSSAVEAMKLGAADYLIKPCNPDELLLVIDRQLEVDALRREVASLRREVATTHRFGELVGDGPAMREVYRVIEAVSRNKSTVLVTGPSGTGKELVARTIHARSPWSRGPFVAVNCGAFSETLLESQLFGHRRGAFTGAISDQPGVFQGAHGGTLFLDEVSEIPLPLQVKFLRALQEREVTPLGTTRAIPVDVRIVAATNRELRREMREGRFREDLFYRLNVVHLELPALEARREDIPLLVAHFVADFAGKYGVAPKRVTDQALQALVSHPWPGNVRELQNAIERAFALSTSDVLDASDVLPALRESLVSIEPGSAMADRAEVAGTDGPAPSARTTALPPAGGPGPTEAGPPGPGVRDVVATLEEVERRAIAAALEASRGNKNEAARLLGIDRQRLYRKIEKYRLG
ncbi:MAG: sigma-54-dependent transcriptional regulator [Alphaproteobacteria bacterium]